MIKFDWNLLFTFINLIVFFVLMKLFLFKPIKKTIEKRNELIDQQFKDAQSANAQAAELKGQYEAKLSDANEESERIINDAKNNAKVEYSKIIDRANDDARKLKDDAKKQIEAENRLAKKEANKELANLAIQAAEKVIGSSISTTTDSDIFDEFLKEGSDK